MAPSQGRSRGLKTLQWLIRAAQLGASIIVMGIYVYFLVSLHDHNLSIPSSVPSVTGIAGAAILYDLLALLLLCRLAGRPAASFVAMLFDVAFGSAFIYVTVANKGGASQCTGQVSTVFGSGKDGDAVEGEGGSDFVKLPGLRTACKLQTACLAIAIILVYALPSFPVFTPLLETNLIPTASSSSSPPSPSSASAATTSARSVSPPRKRTRPSTARSKRVPMHKTTPRNRPSPAAASSAASLAARRMPCCRSRTPTPSRSTPIQIAITVPATAPTLPR